MVAPRLPTASSRHGNNRRNGGNDHRGNNGNNNELSSSKSCLIWTMACCWPLIILALFASSTPRYLTKDGSSSSDAVDGTGSNTVLSTLQQTTNLRTKMREVLDRVDVLGYGPTHPRVAVVVTATKEKKDQLISTVESIFARTDLQRLLTIVVVVDGLDYDADLVQALKKIESGSVPHWHGDSPDLHDHAKDSDSPHGRLVQVLFNKNPQGVASMRNDGALFAHLLAHQYEKAGLKSPHEDLILLLLSAGAQLTSRYWLGPVTDALIVAPPLLGDIQDTSVAVKLANAVAFGLEDDDSASTTSFDASLTKTVGKATADELNQSSGASYATPAWNGAAIAMRLETFLHLPMQDLSLTEAWPADLDLALNLWLCADGIDVLSSVYTQVLWRNDRVPAPLPPNLAARLAGAWMDAHLDKQFYHAYLHASGNTEMTYLEWITYQAMAQQEPTFTKDLSSKCRSFKWYIENVHHELSDVLTQPDIVESIPQQQPVHIDDVKENNNNNNNNNNAAVNQQQQDNQQQDGEEEADQEQDGEEEDNQQQDGEGEDNQEQDGNGEKEDNQQQDGNGEKEANQQQEGEKVDNQQQQEVKKEDNQQQQQEQQKDEEKEQQQQDQAAKVEPPKVILNEKPAAVLQQERKVQEAAVAVGAAVAADQQLPPPVQQVAQQEQQQPNNEGNVVAPRTSGIKPSKPLCPECLEIVQRAKPVDISFVDVSNGHKDHPHMGARDAEGNLGYIYNETSLRLNPPPFSFAGDDLTRACSKRDNNYKMLHEKVFVDIKAHEAAEASNKKRDKIFCLVYTIEPGHVNIPRIRETWGPKCDGFMVASNKTDVKIGTVDIVHEGPEEYNNIWQKVRSMWSYVYDNYYEKYDWFHIGGDDLYLILENLRLYLESEEIKTAANGGIYLPDGTETTQTPLFLGRRFAYQGDMQNIFNSGGSGYTLNKAALKTLVVEGFPNLFPHAHTFSEDTMVAKLLRNYGIFPYETKDETGAERYMPFMPGHHYGYRLPTDPSTDWYAKYSINIKEGVDHCAARSVAFHYVKEESMYRLHALLYHLCPAETV